MLPDGVEQCELLAIEGVVLGGGVDVDGAEEVFAEDNRGADGGSDLVFLDRIAGGESWVGHGVGGEDALADHGSREDGA